MNKILSLLPLGLTEYPEYVEHHLNVVPRTRELEADAKELIRKNFPKSLLRQFIINVHKWGGLSEHIEDNLRMVLNNVQLNIFL